MATEYETILVDFDRGVTTITLNRPEQRNAINLTMEQELYAAIQAAEHDDAVRVIVVTGAGSAFCSGVDLAGGSAFGADAHAEHDAALGVTSDTIWERVAYWRLKTPIIGAINGHAIGVGMTLPMLFDIRYVAEDAKLSFVFTRRGIVPEANSTWLVPRLIGLSRGLDLLLSGRQFSGREAAEWGLASQALPADRSAARRARARARHRRQHRAAVGGGHQAADLRLHGRRRPPGRDQPRDEAHVVGRGAAGRAWRGSCRGSRSARPTGRCRSTSSRRPIWRDDSARGGGRGEERGVGHLRQHGLQRCFVEAGGAGGDRSHQRRRRVHRHARFARR